jgi:hypothetical protein
VNATELCSGMGVRVPTILALGARSVEKTAHGFSLLYDLFDEL